MASARTNFVQNLSVGIDRMALWDPAVDWSGSELDGRVTLAGESAYCVPPHHGDGLNNALQDAALLVDELDAVDQGKKSLKEAVQAYEKDLKERTVTQIPLSMAQAKMVHSAETLVNAPFIKMGMHRCIRQGKGVALAILPATR
jgi:2-polyprenyl-6-methoxyphenol hydroxylase-like FAD-dependent oxidoreductase